MNHVEPLELALAYLVAPKGDQLRFMAELPPWGFYRNRDGESVEYRASEACLHACAAILVDRGELFSSEEKAIIGEIYCVISMMTSLATSVIDYHMDIDKTGSLSAAGPFDSAWDVLRRLVAALRLKHSTLLSAICPLSLFKAGHLELIGTGAPAEGNGSADPV